MEAARSRIALAWPEIDDRIARGVVAGVAAGLVFLLLNMAWATRSDLPAVAPLIDISTIFNVEDKPVASPENISVGLVTHLTLSMLFGVAFAAALPLIRGARLLALAGVGFGLALYVVNFQILGRTLFPWFQEGPDQVFEVFAHGLFGLLLVPFFLGMQRRLALRGDSATSGT